MGFFRGNVSRKALGGVAHGAVRLPAKFSQHKHEKVGKHTGGTRRVARVVNEAV